MKKRYRRSALAAVVISLLGIFLAKSSPVVWQHPTESAQVRHVVDGDTIELRSGESVRYIGIDCPEIHKKTSQGWQDVSESYGQEAARLNEQLVAGKDVRLEFDIQKRDKYQRLLAYCFVKDGDKEIFVQAEILRKGLAYLYTFVPNVKYIDTLVEALKDAQNNQRGVWSGDLWIESKDAPRFVGERKRVSGEVRRAYETAKTIRMTMTGLNVVIFKKDLDIFERQGIDPLRFYKDKNVMVFGLIKLYQGKPEIIVSDPWQIEIVN